MGKVIERRCSFGAKRSANVKKKFDHHDIEGDVIYWFTDAEGNKMRLSGDEVNKILAETVLSKPEEEEGMMFSPEVVDAIAEICAERVAEMMSKTSFTMITKEQACTRYSMSPNTLMKYAKAAGAYCKPDKLVLIDVVALEEYFRKHKAA